MKRLFFALWPDPETRARCAAVSSILEAAGKPVKPDNLHVTLVFLGGIEETLEAKLAEAASAIQSGTFAIRFDKLEYWPRPRVICLCGKPENPKAEALVGQLNALADALGIPTEDRPYKPHVTLIRKAKKLRVTAFEPIVWQAGAFCLAESRSTAEGVVYRVLRTWPLTDRRMPFEPEAELTNPNAGAIIAPPPLIKHD